MMVEHYKIELALVCLLGLYAMNYIYGSRQNEAVVLAWANRYALHNENTLYGRNFSLVGLSGKSKRSEVIFRKNQSTYVCYASGRRHCRSVLTTLSLKKRQDAVSVAWYLMNPKDDRITVEVAMDGKAMAPAVFAVVRRKEVKALTNSGRDVRHFAKVCEPTKERAPQWPKRLTILAESKDLQTDLISDAAMKLVFRPEAFKRLEPYFVSMHFTTEARGGGGGAQGGGGGWDFLPGPPA